LKAKRTKRFFRVPDKKMSRKSPVRRTKVRQSQNARHLPENSAIIPAESVAKTKSNSYFWERF
jgi:hypothetical protein